MAESRVHELLSGLTVVLRSNGEARKIDKKNIDKKKLLKSRGPTPQVIIYTRHADGDFGPTFISDNIISQLGYAPQELIENPSAWEDALHPDDKGRVLSSRGELFGLGYLVQEYRLRHKNKEYRWIRDELNLVRDSSGKPSEILGSWIDITERRQVEQALRESEARYRSLVDRSPMGMISFDTNGDITEFNPAVLSILGASHLDVEDAMDLFSLLPLVEAGISEAIVHCLESGESGVGEFQYKAKSDRQVHTQVHVVPIRDGDNHISGAHGFLLDISDQKRAEELIIGSERLKVLGQISTGVGHTFSNLLQVVSGNVNVALTNLDLKDSDAVKGNLEQIMEGVRSATEAVRWMQQFARRRSDSSQNHEIFDLSEAVEEAVEMCKLWSKTLLDRKKIRIKHEVELAPGCHILGVQDQVAWVALNLLKNAVEAMPKGGTIRTKTYVKDRLAVLSVQDSGIGIPPENMKHITTAFWTSKEAHAGMGLPFSCGILRSHNGTMGVKRVRPRGSLFLIRFPYVNPLLKKTDSRDPLNKGLRILFIDDDERIVRVFERGLRALGHSLVPAYSGQQGLKLFAQTQIDAVVCDLAMSEVSGWEVAKRVAKYCKESERQKPPFIMLTGWARQLDEDEVQMHPEVDRILQKPVKVPHLVEMVQEEIGRIQSQEDFSGRIGGIDILEYMQLLLLNGREMLVSIQSREGQKGLIFVKKGEIIHAVTGTMEGEEALYHCLLFKGGSFSSLPWRDPDHRSITKPGVFLLIEAARKRDERKDSITQDIPLLKSE